MLLRLEVESRMPTGWEPLRPRKILALPCCKVLDKLLKGSLALDPEPPSKYKLPVEFLLSETTKKGFYRLRSVRLNISFAFCVSIFCYDYLCLEKKRFELKFTFIATESI